MRVLMIGVGIVTGLAALANGLFMLVSPDNWYLAVPGVTTTGIVALTQAGAPNHSPH